MVFRDRRQAAGLLAERLAALRLIRPLVLGIPRGAVPMAALIAERLGGELDVVLVRKLGAPGNPEFALGAVSEFGQVYLSGAKAAYDIPSEFIERERERELEILKSRRAAYSPLREPISPRGRTVILVDDGLATGATMLVAVRSVRDQRAARIIVAAPVASREAIALVQGEADEVLVLFSPEEFWAISDFYEEFPQVSDDEVAEILRGAERPEARKCG